MRGLVWVVPLCGLLLQACGGASDSERFSLRTPGTDRPVKRESDGAHKARRGEPTRIEKAVIRGWADALRAGHVGEAADFFAVPALVADGTNPLRRLTDRAAVVEFNRTLPCGAKLTATQRGDRSLVIASFKLTERPGPGECGTGVGESAYTAFLIEKRHITEWRRASAPPKPAKSGDPS